MSIESDIEYHQRKLRGYDIQVAALREWLGERLKYNPEAVQDGDISLVGYLIENLNGDTERGYHEKKLAELQAPTLLEEPSGEFTQAAGIPLPPLPEGADHWEFEPAGGKPIAIYPPVPLDVADLDLTEAKLADEADDDRQYRKESGDLGAIGNFQS